VDLDGAGLAVVADDSCKPLWPGTSYTLLTSTGAITGSFDNASEGQEIPVEFPKGCTIEQTLQIHYERNGATQTVTGRVISGPTSTTTLEASPAHPVTNQNVTLAAIVHASAETPSGKIEFRDGGRLIKGCEASPLVAVGLSYAATCSTSFTASESPVDLSADFLPGLGVNINSSITTDDLAIDLGPTTTSLQVSLATSPVNQNVGLVATLSPADPGVVQPEGTVQFADDGIPIGSCSTQPLQQSFLSTSLTAMCLLSYPTQGTHGITARYSGDPDFAASSSPAQTLTVQASQEEQSLEEPESGKAKLDATKIPIQDRTLAIVKLTCEGVSNCHGTLGLSVRETLGGKHGKKRVRSVGIGSEAFSIEAGKTVSVDVRLNKAGRTLLGSQKKGQIKATLKLAQGSGTTQTNIRLSEAIPGSKKKKASDVNAQP
jgi:Bacterial Ig-like domain (group 3)